MGRGAGSPTKEEREAFEAGRKAAQEWREVHEWGDRQPIIGGRFSRTRTLLRAAGYLYREHAGTLVSAAGILAALGGALVAIGLVQAGSAVKPLDNGWVATGVILMVIGVAFALWTIAALLVVRIRDERLQFQLMARLDAGAGFQRNLREGDIPSHMIDEWHRWTAGLLSKIDPTHGLFLRFMSTAGLPVVSPPEGASEEYALYFVLLEQRMTRLHEFVAEMKR
jgi:hypothetical protein